MAKSRLIGPLFIVVLCLGMVACSVPAPASPGGGAPPSGQSAPNNNAVAQQGVDNKVVTIGLSSVLSGPASVGAQTSIGTKAYLDMLNRNGGVNGYTFKYVERDNAYQPAQSVAVAQQLVNEDKVFAMVVSGTLPTQAQLPTAASLRVPVLAQANGDLLQQTIPNVYGFNPRYSLLPLFHARDLIQNRNLKSIAYVYEDDSVGQPALKYLPDYLSSIGGKLVASLGFPLDVTDMSSFATKLKESGADGVIFIGLSQFAILQKAADAIGYHPTYETYFSNMVPSFMDLAGPLAEGVYLDSHVEPPDASTPEAQTYRDEMKRAGQEANIGVLSAGGWTVGAGIEEGVRRATANGAPLTWDSFTNALNTFNNLQLGMQLSLTYTPTDHTGASKTGLYQVQQRKFVQISGPTDIPNPDVKQ